jgi:cell division protein FtsZ
LFYITGGQSLTLQEVNEAAEVIRKAVDPGANIIFGVALDPKAEDEGMDIILIATGFSRGVKKPLTPTTEEKHKLLKNLEDESTLDIPTFLRYPSVVRRAQTPVVAARPIVSPPGSRP